MKRIFGRAGDWVLAFARRAMDFPKIAPVAAEAASAKQTMTMRRRGFCFLMALPDRERFHQLGAAAIGVEQVQLPATVASDLRRANTRRIAGSFARRFQSLLNIGHEQRHVMQRAELLPRGSRCD